MTIRLEAKPDKAGLVADMMLATQQFGFDSRTGVGCKSRTGVGCNSRTGVGAMLAAGRIGYAEAAAAHRWTEDYALAEFGARDPGARRGSSAASPTGVADAKLFAATSRRKARAALGSRLDKLLIAALADGLTAKDIAAQLGEDARFVAGMIAAALILLATHYTAEQGRVQ